MTVVGGEEGVDGVGPPGRHPHPVIAPERRAPGKVVQQGRGADERKPEGHRGEPIEVDARQFALARTSLAAAPAPEEAPARVH